MHLVCPLVTHRQSAELVQPCQGPLDNAPVHAQPTAMPSAPFGDRWCDVRERGDSRCSRES